MECGLKMDVKKRKELRSVRKWFKGKKNMLLAGLYALGV